MRPRLPATLSGPILAGKPTSTPTLDSRRGVNAASTSCKLPKRRLQRPTKALRRIPRAGMPIPPPRIVSAGLTDISSPSVNAAFSQHHDHQPFNQKPQVMIAAIYARKSTDQNGIADEQKSVARQVDHARQYARKKGWTVDDAYIYVDDGISGAEFANRPGYLRLLNALKPRPTFQVLVMSEESRLGREAIETAYALKQLVTGGVRVFFYLGIASARLTRRPTRSCCR
jgi:resolvase-like protein